MLCTKCGAELAPDSAFCANCGASVNAAPESPVCASCGAPLEAGSAFCANCGASVNAAPNYNAAPDYNAAPNYNAPYGAPVQEEQPYLAGKDKLTIILLCLFLGGLGIHNFIMGETKKGITRIIASFCCGLGGILALVDLIMICTDKYVVDTEKLFF